MNNSRVVPARVFLRKKKTNGRLEALFFRKKNELWEVILKKSGKLSEGDILTVENAPEIVFRCHRDKNSIYLEELTSVSIEDFERFGEMPIPPYLKRRTESSDKTNYQTIFAKEYGSAAAPTASLHFTKELLEKVRHKTQIEEVTLHIGYSTFAPLREENFIHNKLHKEYYSMPEKLAKCLAEKNYSRLVVVGTTALRVLETVYRKTNGRFDGCFRGETELFLHPPDAIETADVLITNFHLPDSSLFLLVSCFVEPQRLNQAYEYAIKNKYRFYSYGDAMMIC